VVGAEPVAAAAVVVVAVAVVPVAWERVVAAEAEEVAEPAGTVASDCR
jgi:hypothetical protein